jgi:hypothetical protein
MQLFDTAADFGGNDKFGFCLKGPAEDAAEFDRPTLYRCDFYRYGPFFTGGALLCIEVIRRWAQERIYACRDKTENNNDNNSGGSAVVNGHDASFQKSVEKTKAQNLLRFDRSLDTP